MPVDRKGNLPLHMMILHRREVVSLVCDEKALSDYSKDLASREAAYLESRGAYKMYENEESFDLFRKRGEKRTLLLMKAARTGSALHLVWGKQSGPSGGKSSKTSPSDTNHSNHSGNHNTTQQGLKLGRKYMEKREKAIKVKRNQRAKEGWRTVTQRLGAPPNVDSIRRTRLTHGASATLHSATTSLNTKNSALNGGIQSLRNQALGPSSNNLASSIGDGNNYVRASAAYNTSFIGNLSGNRTLSALGNAGGPGSTFVRSTNPSKTKTSTNLVNNGTVTTANNLSISTSNLINPASMTNLKLENSASTINLTTPLLSYPPVTQGPGPSGNTRATTAAVESAGNNNIHTLTTEELLDFWSDSDDSSTSGASSFDSSEEDEFSDGADINNFLGEEFRDSDLVNLTAELDGHNLDSAVEDSLNLRGTGSPSNFLNKESLVRGRTVSSTVDENANNSTLNKDLIDKNNHSRTNSNSQSGMTTRSTNLLGPSLTGDQITELARILKVVITPETMHASLQVNLAQNAVANQLQAGGGPTGGVLLNQATQDPSQSLNNPSPTNINTGTVTANNPTSPTNLGPGTQQNSSPAQLANLIQQLAAQQGIAINSDLMQILIQRLQTKHFRRSTRRDSDDPQKSIDEMIKRASLKKMLKPKSPGKGDCYRHPNWSKNLGNLALSAARQSKLYHRDVEKRVLAIVDHAADESEGKLDGLQTFIKASTADYLQIEDPSNKNERLSQDMVNLLLTPLRTRSGSTNIREAEGPEYNYQDNHRITIEDASLLEDTSITKDNTQTNTNFISPVSLFSSAISAQSQDYFSRNPNRLMAGLRGETVNWVGLDEGRATGGNPNSLQGGGEDLNEEDEAHQWINIPAYRRDGFLISGKRYRFVPEYKTGTRVVGLSDLVTSLVVDAGGVVPQPHPLRCLMQKRLRGLKAQLLTPNNAGLGALSLAAKVRNRQIFEIVLNHSANVIWGYGNVRCVQYPLLIIDSMLVKERDLWFIGTSLAKLEERTHGREGRRSNLDEVLASKATSNLFNIIDVDSTKSKVRRALDFLKNTPTKDVTERDLNNMKKELGCGTKREETDGPGILPSYTHKSVLEVLVEGDCSECLTPLVTQLLIDKWECYACNIYYTYMALYVINFCTLWFVTEIWDVEISYQNLIGWMWPFFNISDIFYGVDPTRSSSESSLTNQAAAVQLAKLVTGKELEDLVTSTHARDEDSKSLQQGGGKKFEGQALKGGDGIIGTEGGLSNDEHNFNQMIFGRGYTNQWSLTAEQFNSQGIDGPFGIIFGLMEIVPLLGYPVSCVFGMMIGKIFRPLLSVLFGFFSYFFYLLGGSETLYTVYSTIKTAFVTTIVVGNMGASDSIRPIPTEAEMDWLDLVIEFLRASIVTLVLSLNGFIQVSYISLIALGQIFCPVFLSCLGQTLSDYGITEAVKEESKYRVQWADNFFGRDPLTDATFANSLRLDLSEAVGPNSTVPLGALDHDNDGIPNAFDAEFLTLRATFLSNQSSGNKTEFDVFDYITQWLAYFLSWIFIGCGPYFNSWHTNSTNDTGSSKPWTIRVLPLPIECSVFCQVLVLLGQLGNIQETYRGIVKKDEADRAVEIAKMEGEVKPEDWSNTSVSSANSAIKKTLSAASRSTINQTQFQSIHAKSISGAKLLNYSNTMQSSSKSLMTKSTSSLESRLAPTVTNNTNLNYTVTNRQTQDTMITAGGDHGPNTIFGNTTTPNSDSNTPLVNAIGNGGLGLIAINEHGTNSNSTSQSTSGNATHFTPADREIYPIASMTTFTSGLTTTPSSISATVGGAIPRSPDAMSSNNTNLNFPFAGVANLTHSHDMQSEASTSFMGSVLSGDPGDMRVLVNSCPARSDISDDLNRSRSPPEHVNNNLTQTDSHGSSLKSNAVSADSAAVSNTNMPPSPTANLPRGPRDKDHHLSGSTVIPAFSGLKLDTSASTFNHSSTVFNHSSTLFGGSSSLLNQSTSPVHHTTQNQMNTSTRADRDDINSKASRKLREPSRASVGGASSQRSFKPGTSGPGTVGGASQSRRRLVRAKDSQRTGGDVDGQSMMSSRVGRDYGNRSEKAGTRLTSQFGGMSTVYSTRTLDAGSGNRTGVGAFDFLSKLSPPHILLFSIFSKILTGAIESIADVLNIIYYLVRYRQMPPPNAHANALRQVKQSFKKCSMAVFGYDIFGKRTVSKSAPNEGGPGSGSKSNSNASPSSAPISEKSFGAAKKPKEEDSSSRSGGKSINNDLHDRATNISRSVRGGVTSRGGPGAGNRTSRRLPQGPGGAAGPAMSVSSRGLTRQLSGLSGRLTDQQSGQPSSGYNPSHNSGYPAGLQSTPSVISDRWRQLQNVNKYGGGPGSLSGVQSSNHLSFIDVVRAATAGTNPNSRKAQEKLRDAISNNYPMLNKVVSKIQQAVYNEQTQIRLKRYLTTFYVYTVTAPNAVEHALLFLSASVVFALWVYQRIVRPTMYLWGVLLRSLSFIFRILWHIFTLITFVFNFNSNSLMNGVPNFSNEADSNDAATDVNFSFMYITFATLATVLHLVHYLRAWRFAGPLVLSLKEIVQKDISRFIVIYATLLFGFSHLFRVAFRYAASMGSPENQVTSPAMWQILAFLFRASVGDTEFETLESLGGDERNAAFEHITHITVLIYMLWIVLSLVVLTNILIAMMSTTFGDKYDNRLSEWKLQRCSVILMGECSSLAKLSKGWLQRPVFGSVDRSHRFGETTTTSEAVTAAAAPVNAESSPTDRSSASVTVEGKTSVSLKSRSPTGIDMEFNPATMNKSTSDPESTSGPTEKNSSPPLKRANSEPRMSKLELAEGIAAGEKSGPSVTSTTETNVTTSGGGGGPASVSRKRSDGYNKLPKTLEEYFFVQYWRAAAVILSESWERGRATAQEILPRNMNYPSVTTQINLNMNDNSISPGQQQSNKLSYINFDSSAALSSGAAEPNLGSGASFESYSMPSANTGSGSTSSTVTRPSYTSANSPGLIQFDTEFLSKASIESAFDTLILLPSYILDRICSLVLGPRFRALPMLQYCLIPLVDYLIPLFGLEFKKWVAKNSTTNHSLGLGLSTVKLQSHISLGASTSTTRLSKSQSPRRSSKTLSPRESKVTSLVLADSRTSKNTTSPVLRRSKNTVTSIASTVTGGPISGTAPVDEKSIRDIIDRLEAEQAETTSRLESILLSGSGADGSEISARPSNLPGPSSPARGGGPAGPPGAAQPTSKESLRMAFAKQKQRALPGGGSSSGILTTSNTVTSTTQGGSNVNLRGPAIKRVSTIGGSPSSGSTWSPESQGNVTNFSPGLSFSRLSSPNSNMVSNRESKISSTTRFSKFAVNLESRSSRIDSVLQGKYLDASYLEYLDDFYFGWIPEKFCLLLFLTVRIYQLVLRPPLIVGLSFLSLYLECLKFLFVRFLWPRFICPLLTPVMLKRQSPLYHYTGEILLMILDAMGILPPAPSIYNVGYAAAYTNFLSNANFSANVNSVAFGGESGPSRSNFASRRGGNPNKSMSRGYIGDRVSKDSSNNTKQISFGAWTWKFKVENIPTGISWWFLSLPNGLHIVALVRAIQNFFFRILAWLTIVPNTTTTLSGADATTVGHNSSDGSAKLASLAAKVPRTPTQAFQALKRRISNLELSELFNQQLTDPVEVLKLLRWTDENVVRPCLSYLDVRKRPFHHVETIAKLENGMEIQTWSMQCEVCS